MELTHDQSPLLSADFVRQTIINHYFPLFVPEFHQALLKFFYKKGIEFFVNGQKVVMTESAVNPRAKLFRVYVGGQAKRQPAGFGYVAEHEAHEPFGRFGLAISTYGKIIKYGWEWLGVSPKINTNIYGVVEIPGIAEILTLNKMDFLKDAASLKKYYKFRKAIQEAVLPILEAMGEKPESKEKSQALKPLAAEVERTLKNMMSDFPELAPLLGVKRVSGKNASRMFADKPLVGVVEELNDLKSETPKLGNKVPQDSTPQKPAKKKQSRGPAIFIGFEAGEEAGALSRMIESRILVNISHSSYVRALAAGYADYHVVVCVAWTLSQFLQEEHSMHQFINDFLSSWGKNQPKIQKLLP